MMRATGEGRLLEIEKYVEGEERRCRDYSMEGVKTMKSNSSFEENDR
jgi:hypothetical protein